MTGNITTKTTIPRLVSGIRAVNPESPVSEYAIRTAIHNGKIQAVKIGNKYIIDPDEVEGYYSGAVSAHDSDVRTTIGHPCSDMNITGGSNLVLERMGGTMARVVQ